MSSDDQQTPASPAMTVTPAETAATPIAAPDLLAVAPTNAPILAEPAMLVHGLRYLQRRIPEFTQMTWQQKRSHARAANLDPEFIESGLQAAAVWRDTKSIIERSAEDLRNDQEEIRRWDEVVVELRAITAGIEAANLKRKHRLGTAILKIYAILEAFLRTNHPDDVYMRPYFENMKRAYLRTQQFRKRKKKGETTGS